MQKIPFGKPILGEEEKNIVNEVLSGNILVHGSKSLEFEESFCNFTKSPYAVSVSSCTAGMHLVYHALGLGKGDEVIVPAQTHIATAHAVELVGAKAVFIDSEIETGNIDCNLIINSINENTKAISLVHYLGVPANMEKICKIAKENNLFVLEDCALALGAQVNKKHVGLLGDVGVFSFYPVKHITTAEGGMIILKDKKLADKLRLLKAFGVNKSFQNRKVQGLYDAVDLGFNYRMSEIHCAIGIEQMKKLPFFLEKRKENFEFFESRLKNSINAKILPQPTTNNLQSSFYCIGLVLDKNKSNLRTQIMEELKKEGIGSSIYYPAPVPRMSYYKKKYGYDEEKFKIAASISDQIIALPIGPHLDKKDMSYMYNKLISIWRNLNV